MQAQQKEIVKAEKQKLGEMKTHFADIVAQEKEMIKN